MQAFTIFTDRDLDGDGSVDLAVQGRGGGGHDDQRDEAEHGDAEHRIDQAGAEKARQDYHTFLRALGAGEVDPEELKPLYYANDHAILNPTK